EGIQYNPEALEIFVMQKLFILSDWLKSQQIPALSRLKFFAQQFGYDIDEEFLSRL
ncbi:MAG: chlororespiratory reduction 6 domain-containing protein, partial [Microcystis panniformis]